jgi:hypothetical protein
MKSAEEVASAGSIGNGDRRLIVLVLVVVLVLKKVSIADGQ